MRRTAFAALDTRLPRRPDGDDPGRGGPAVTPRWGRAAAELQAVADPVAVPLADPVVAVPVEPAQGSARRPAPGRGPGAAPQPTGRAYDGPAHGAEWPLLSPDEPRDVVEFAAGGRRRVLYRLARHPRTGAPALDQHGRYLYVPALSLTDRAVPPHPARVSALRAAERAVAGPPCR